MRYALAAAFAILAFPVSLEACDCVRWLPGPHFEADVDRVVAYSIAIVDGVVEKPATADGQPAVLRATHIWKGPKQQRFLVNLVSDCSLVLDSAIVRRDQRVRLILFGGPANFEASRCANFQNEAFNQAIEKRLPGLQKKEGRPRKMSGPACPLLQRRIQPNSGPAIARASS